MNYAMCRPQWPSMNDEADAPGHRHREREGRRERRRQERDFGPGPGPEGPDAMGPGPFGPGGPAGPGGWGMGRGGRGGRGGFGPGPFGPGGFGPGGFGPGDGPMGHGRGRGRARRGDVRNAILALLAEQPMNGYQVIQALDERTNGVWKPSPGAIYPALAQLEDEALIEPFDNDGQKAYRLTETGKAAASGIETKPWDAVNDESGANTEGALGLWKEFGSLAMAMRSVAATGTPAQLKAAAELVAETRKRLFGILASDESE